MSAESIVRLFEKYRICAIMFEIKILADLLVEVKKVESDLQEAYKKEDYEEVPDLVEKWWGLQSYIGDVRGKIAELNSSCFMKNRRGGEK